MFLFCFPKGFLFFLVLFSFFGFCFPHFCDDFFARGVTLLSRSLQALPKPCPPPLPRTWGGLDSKPWLALVAGNFASLFVFPKVFVFVWSALAVFALPKVFWLSDWLFLFLQDASNTVGPG